MRPSAESREIRVGRFGWAAEIPWLPDLLAVPRSVTGNVLSEAFGRQIAFLRALAGGAPPGAAVQLRYTALPDSAQVRCHLVAAANSQQEADLLSRVVAASLPPELPLRPVEPKDINGVLRAVDADGLTSDSVVEIRRSVDSLDPTLEGDTAADPVIFPWSWSAQALLGSLGLMRQQQTTTSLVIHVEPARLDGSGAIYLQDEIARLAAELREGAEQPLTRAAIRAYGKWLRLLPRGCLHLRVLLVGDGSLAPGLADSLGNELTTSFEESGAVATGAAAVISPQSGRDLDACAQLIDEVRSVPFQLPAQPELASLLHLFDPVEANAAFRFPVAPRGGLPGLGTQRPSALGEGASERTADASVVLGTTTAGTPFGLAIEDLNQHVLVAGLPGFGKSSTVRLMLRRAHQELNSLPFLVIDPVKDDYRTLMAQITAECGTPTRIVRLTPNDVAFNPLAVPDGVDPSRHAGRVIAAFESAMDFGDFHLGRVLLRRVMVRIFDEMRDGRGNPTMRELYRRMGDSIKRSSFREQDRGNLEGSLLGRLELFTNGLAGRALMGGAQDGIPWAEIMEQPTLIELGEFAGPAERSLMFGLLIAGLVSWREAHPARDELAHLTVLEEAHRVLRPSSNPDAGVAVFMDAIAELRGAGEGFVVVDQSPTALHPQVLKLTGTKLVHRLVEADERAAMSASMVLDPAAGEDIARLARRRIVAYAASSSAAELVEVADERHPSMQTRLDAETTTPPDLVHLSSSLAFKPTFEPLVCVDCPVMCRGFVGAQRADEVVATLKGGAAVHDVLTAAADVIGTTEVRGHRLARAQTYCAAAHAIGVLQRQTPWRLPLLLDAAQDLLRFMDQAAAASARRDEKAVTPS